MEKIKGGMLFHYQYDSASPIVNVILPQDSELGDILAAFEGFLRVAGYSFNGQVDIVEVEMIPQDPNAETN